MQPFGQVSSGGQLQLFQPNRMFGGPCDGKCTLSGIRAAVRNV